MRVKLALCYDPKDSGTAPRVLSALDEYTEDDWGGATPDFWETDIQKGTWSDTCEVRTLTVSVPDDAVSSLFAPPPEVDVDVEMQDGVDWDLLDRQRDLLHEIAESPYLTDAEAADVEGVADLLDAMLSAQVEVQD